MQGGVRFARRRLLFCRTKGSENQFIIHDSQPFAEFTAHFPEAGHLFKAQFLVQGIAGLVAFGDAGYQGMQSAVTAFFYQVLHQFGTQTRYKP